MQYRFAFKDQREEFRLIKNRIILAGLLVVVLFMLVIVRAFYLQVIRHDHFITLSEHNRVKVLPIPPIRGMIFSRDGVLLAENQPSFSLEVIPEQQADIQKTIEKIKTIVPVNEEEINRFYGLLKEKRRFDAIPLRVNLSENEVANFAVNKHLFSGVDVIARLNRRYPRTEETAHVVGYVARISESDLDTIDESNYLGTTHIGKLGVEKAYERLLHGKVGYQQVEVNAQGRIIRVLDRRLPVPGQDLYLTLDSSLQHVATEALSGRRGAIVAIDPNNGDVLAMVSSPAYDTNPFVYGIDNKTYNSLLKSKDKPLINRVLQGTYPPGSTIKPFLGIAALAYNIRPADKKIWCPGWYSLQGSSHRYRDWKKQGHGHADLHYAIMQSCDVYYYSLAHEMGIKNINKALQDFGFGSRVDIDIKGESAGLVPSREWKRATYNQPWYQGETLIAGIGQGSILTTPIQLAVATAALANHGKLYPPSLLQEARDPISNTVIHPQKKPFKQVRMYQQEFWQKIIDAMVDVVHGLRGTARRSGLDAEYRFAGKTGTAQVIGISQDSEYKKEDIPEEFLDHALFIAFAPVEAPRIAIAIIVENGGGGSRTAAPIARRLFDHYLLGKTASG